METTKTDLERFNEKWIEVDGCWEWQASKLRHGYGKFKYRGKMVRAHRQSWVFNFGEIPEGLCVLHICDNPCCVNPLHLMIGTAKDNVDDMVSKGRQNNQIKEKCPRCESIFSTDKIGRRFCKLCQAESSKQWHKDNKDKLRKRRLELYQQNKEHTNRLRRQIYARKKLEAQNAQ